MINGTENNYQTYQGKELDESLGLNWHDFGARNYDATLGRWMNVDPLAEQTGFTYAAMNNNPINMIDPTGMSAKWIPKVNEDGSTAYIAEEGDSAETLSSQYGIDQGQAEEITGTTGNSEIAEGTEVSGKKVEEVTGSQVLKLDLASDQAKGKVGEQRIFDQFLFAGDVAKSNDENRWFAGDFYSNVKTSKVGYGAGLVGDASLTAEGKTFGIIYEMFLAAGDGIFNGKSNSSKTVVSVSTGVSSNPTRGTRLGLNTVMLQIKTYKTKTGFKRPSANISVGSLGDYSPILSRRIEN